MWAQVINILLGLLVMAAPGLWQFGEQAGKNNYIIGPLVITTALVALTEAARNVRWFNIPAGAWLMVSPLFFDFEAQASTLNIFLGIFIVVFSLFKGKVKHRFGGGWRSLLQKNASHIQEADRVP